MVVVWLMSTMALQGVLSCSFAVVMVIRGASAIGNRCGRCGMGLKIAIPDEGKIAC